MTKGQIALAGLCVGAGLMYLADPDEGRRRRRRLRDAAAHRVHVVRGAAVTTSRDVQHRAAGLVARVRGLTAAGTAPIDDVLVARVRARLGHLVSHPRAIDVTAADGVVTLSGPVFEGEVARMLADVARVPGVRRVASELHPHARAERVPALAGVGPLKPPPAFWSRGTPAVRLVAGVAGAGLVAYAMRKPTIAAAATELAGLALIDRAVSGA